MKFKNSTNDYGTISITLHWLVALSVIGLFCLGYWMVDLTYYDTAYRTAPFIHKSIGLILFPVMLMRIFWRFYSPAPKAEEGLTRVEKKAAHTVHILLYMFILMIIVSGYFISTADGRSISVFGWFDVPALMAGKFIDNQADYAGAIHWYLALTLMAFVGLHIAGALKHHFINHDHTLKKIFGIKRN